VTSLSLTVEWVPATDPGAAATSYLLSWRVAALGSSATSQTTTFTTATLSGLSPATAFNITVVAVNALGASTPLSILASTLARGPAIAQARAADGAGDGGFGAGDTVSLTFDAATNQPAGLAWLAAAPAVSLAGWTGVWTSATVCVLAAGPSAAPFVVGLTRFVVADPLRNAAGTAPGDSTSPALTGQWEAAAVQGTASLAGLNVSRSVREGASVSNILGGAGVIDASAGRRLRLLLTAFRGTLTAGGASAAVMEINGTAAALNTSLAAAPVTYTPDAFVNGDDAVAVLLSDAAGVALYRAVISFAILPGEPPLGAQRAPDDQRPPCAVNNAPVLTLPAITSCPPAGLTLGAVNLTDPDALSSPAAPLELQVRAVQRPRHR
jgi:hypothetical protein